MPSPHEHRRRYVPDRERRHGVALCLSGGGYRAALFHLGVLRRLNELGTLGHVDTISGVSGGSILAGYLAQNVPEWPQPGQPIAGFDAIADGFRAFTRKNIRTLWIVRRPFNRTAAVENLQRHYEKSIIRMPLAALPARPRYIFSATDMSFGVNWVFERARMGSYQAGYVKPPPPDWPAARAVAASSCFPPVFEPLSIGLPPATLEGGKSRRADRDELVRDLALTDGGVYDNMGLEPVWKDHRVVLVSDGGAVFDPVPPVGMFRRVGRYLATQGNQAAAVRKRWLIAQFMSEDEEHLRGLYLGIGSTPEHFVEGAEGYGETEVDDVIAQIRTDLDYFTDAEAAVLQNHGYLLADAAVRAHGGEWRAAVAAEPALPFPEWRPGTSLEPLRKSARRRLLGRWRRLDGP